MRQIVSIAAFIMFSACAVNIKDVELPSSFLDTASAYEVSGKNSVFDDKQLNFGPYRTLAINRGNAVRESSKILLRKTKISEVVDFTMIDETGLRSNARAEGVVSEEDTTILDRWLRSEWWYADNRKYKNYFAGSIEIINIGVFEFVIPNAYDPLGYKESKAQGVLISADGFQQGRYEITLFEPEYTGATFLQNTEARMISKGGTTIGALQENHPEKIWINNTASAQDKFIAANLLGLLILSGDLKER